MPLTYDLTKIEDYENVCNVWTTVHKDELMDDEERNEDGKVLRRNAATTALIFACISVGIGSITPENVGKFCARLNIVQRLHGDLLVGPKGPVPVTEEDVFAHIGLKTNASYTDETDAKFLKRQVGDDLKRDGARMQRKYEDSIKVEEPSNA